MKSKITYMIGFVAAITLLAASAHPTPALDGPVAAFEENGAIGEQQFNADGASLRATEEEPGSPQPQTPQRPQYDPQGKKLEPGEAVPKDAFKAAATTACLQLHRPGLTWNITVTFDPNTYPFKITGGSIKGTICGSPNWKVTGGSMGPTLTIKATQTPTASGCATSVTIVGNFQNPTSYKGTYGFNGLSTSFTHTTLFLGFSPFPCP